MGKRTDCEDIICTYCYKKFSPEDVRMHYRLRKNLPSEKNENDNGSKVEDTDEGFSMTRKKRQGVYDAGNGKKLDEKMFKFYTERMKMTESNARMYSMQNDYVEFDTEGGFEYNEKDYEKYGFVESVTYNGIEADRICPFCHNPLVSGAGKMKMVLISVIGDTNAGKTVYFSALQKLIGNKLLYIGENDAEDYNFFAMSTKLPQATNLKPLPSCTMLYTLNNPAGHEERIILIFCDIAGENTRSRENLEKTAFNLPNSSGLLFMIDPTRFREIAKLMGKDDMVSEEQMRVFTAMFHYFRTGDSRLKIPTAVVVTKSDVLQTHTFFNDGGPNAHFVKPNGVNEHENYVNLDKVNKVDKVTREFLETINEGAYLNNTDNVFSNAKFFMVSSLGYDPEVEGDEGVITPNRVTEPFGWLMFENDAAYSRYNKEVEYEVEIPRGCLGLWSSKKIKTAELDFYYKKGENIKNRIQREIEKLSQ